MISRLVEWWGRTSWGWLAILGPILCYLGLLYSLDVFGFAADKEGVYYYRAIDGRTAFRTGVELDLISAAGRMEYALVSTIYLIVSAFSILWALPKIVSRPRNPFGGLFGFLIVFGLSAFLYFVYTISDYNIRIAFADEILRLGERANALSNIDVSFIPFGFTMFTESMPQSQILATAHSVVYLLGNTATWVLVVFMATIASFEPRTLGRETHKKLRQRMAELQIGLVLAALNLVLSVAYLRTMMAWPVNMLEEELSALFLIPATRYAAVIGALGSVIMISLLAPAYIALTRQFDRIAEQELKKGGDDYISFEERLDWRRRHGLLLSSQQTIAAGAAVLAPMITAPTLDGATGAEQAPQTHFEQRVGTR